MGSNALTGPLMTSRLGAATLCPRMPCAVLLSFAPCLCLCLCLCLPRLFPFVTFPTRAPCRRRVLFLKLKTNLSLPHVRHLAEHSFIMAEQLKLKSTLMGHGGWVTQIATTPEVPDMILSASRDKTAKVWSLLPAAADGAGGDEGAATVAWATSCKTPKLPGSVTALDVAPTLFDGNYVLAAGLEDGQLHLFKFVAQEISPLHSFDRRLCPGLTVQRLRWRATQDARDDAGTPPHWKAQFACGSDDTSVRILDVAIQL